MITVLICSIFCRSFSLESSLALERTLGCCSISLYMNLLFSLAIFCFSYFCLRYRFPCFSSLFYFVFAISTGASSALFLYIFLKLAKKLYFFYSFSKLGGFFRDVTELFRDGLALRIEDLLFDYLLSRFEFPAIIFSIL